MSAERSPEQKAVVVTDSTTSLSPPLTTRLRKETDVSIFGVAALFEK